MTQRPAPSDSLARMLRKGFTLIEVLAAMLIIDVALLALVAGSAVLVRQANAARARADALRVASNRIEQLGARGCSSGSGEAASQAGTHEFWSAQVLGNRTRELCDSVVFFSGAVAHSVILRTRIQC
jgi:prepilin-type N-terminal cleavage/methylation domain-containing protein